ncbi:MAG: ABC transporter permease [Lachnospiraceae bacterium]|nr:ABC transporter permease [Lachnospiraceae bacterium]
MNKNTYNRFSICLRLFIKRLLNKISFILILCLLPVLSLGLKYLLKDAAITIRAGLYSEDTGPFAEYIIQQLSKNSEGITFREFSSKDEMLDSVRTRTYECGFVFSEDFSLRLSEGDTAETVGLYVSPGTAAGSIAAEYVYSEIFTLYAFEEFMDFIGTRTYLSFSPKELSSLRDRLQPAYTEYLNSDETFSFEYKTPAGSVKDTSVMLPDYILGSASGIAALFIMLGAFAGTLHLYRDSRKGIFHAFPARTRTLCKLADIFSGTFLTALSALVTITICNGVETLPVTLIHLLLYTIICTVYCYLLYKLLPNIRIFSAVMPILIMGSIIFCPILIDFSVVLPEFNYLKWGFLPTYFLG